MRIPAAVSLVGAALILFAAVGSFYLAAEGMGQHVALPDVLEYSAPVKAADSALGLTVSHVKEGKLGLSNLGLLVLLISAIVIFLAFKFPEKRTLLILVGSFGIVALRILSRPGRSMQPVNTSLA